MDYYAKGSSIILRQSDFDLAQTLDCGQAFRWENCGDCWQGFFGDKFLKISQNGDIFTFFNTDENEFLDTWANYFDLYTDYKELKESFSECDQTLKKACDYAGGIRLLRQDFWETLVSFIISQNNNIPRIKGIIARLCDMFGRFPASDDILSAGTEGLSPIRAGFRAKYLVDASQKVSKGIISEQSLKNMETARARSCLMQIKGVGPKVADCVMLFGLYKTDAFPIDVWIRRVLEKYYPNGFPSEIAQNCGIAQQYLFHYERSFAVLEPKK